MSANAILLPCAGMVLVTFLVWLALYRERIGEIRRRRIRPQHLATRKESAALLERQNASDNFRNLFEVPVLFYALCIAVAVSGMSDTVFVAGAWLFVAMRAAHSYIHVTYNRVMHRFYAYVASSGLLFALWALFAVRLILA